MKIQYLLSVTFTVLCFTISFAQKSNFNKEFEPIRSELTDWDPVRGPWLANSITAMSIDQKIPPRPFRENFTPHQMMRMVPLDRRRKIATIASRTEVSAPMDDERWSRVRRFTSNSNCQTISGRTYGDPHIVSYDGTRISFQTVGEFILTKSSSGNMEVQTRQKAINDNFSLNSAVAMNVGGDRLCIYASDYPDANYSTPVRLNGKPVNITAGTYFLERGGTIRKSADTYIVDWPTGETVTAKMRRSSGSDFIDVGVKVINCSSGSYTGLMGNANGNARDDYDFITAGSSTDFFGGNSQYRNKVRQADIAKRLADAFRITQMTSLFDYEIGKTTESFTNRSYPRVHYDLNDLSNSRLNRSRRYCERQGIPQSDINGCIYDNAFLNLSASRETVVPDPTEGTVLRPVTGEIENVNPREEIRQVDRQPPVRPSSSNDRAIKTPNKGTGYDSGRDTGGAPVKDSGGNPDTDNKVEPFKRTTTERDTKTDSPFSNSSTRTNSTPRPTSRSFPTPSSSPRTTPTSSPRATPSPTSSPTRSGATIGTRGGR